MDDPFFLIRIQALLSRLAFCQTSVFLFMFEQNTIFIAVSELWQNQAESTEITCMPHPCSYILCLIIILPEQDLVRVDEFVFSLFKCIIFIRVCLHLVFSYIFNNVKIDEGIIWLLELRCSKCLSVYFLIMFLFIIIF